MNTTCKHAVCPATLSDTGLCDCTLERMKSVPTPCACLINDDDEYERRCAFHRDKEQEAANQAIEEAAKVAETEADKCDVPLISRRWISRAIRNLKTKE